MFKCISSHLTIINHDVFTCSAQKSTLQKHSRVVYVRPKMTKCFQHVALTLSWQSLSPSHTWDWRMQSTPWLWKARGHRHSLYLGQHVSRAHVYLTPRVTCNSSYWKSQNSRTSQPDLGQFWMVNGQWQDSVIPAWILDR